jgi:Mce-associated membrane protein
MSDVVPRGKGRPIAVAAVLVALAAAILCGLQAHRAGAVDDARAEALAAAEKRVPDLLSYDSATLEEDLRRARSQTTGDFTADYGRILTDVVAPQAKARSISTRAVVGAAGVVRGDADEVVVLLFLTQTTSTGAGGADGTSVAGSRVEVTMLPDGDGWKIGSLEPV